MRKALSVLLMGAALTLAAQDGQSWLVGQVGATVEQGKSKDIYKDGLHYGLGFGHWWTDRWGFDVKALQSDLKAKSGVPIKDDHEQMLLGSVLYDLAPGGNWYPYLAFGLGGSKLPQPRHHRPHRQRLHGPGRCEVCPREPAFPRRQP